MSSSTYYVETVSSSENCSGPAGSMGFGSKGLTTNNDGLGFRTTESSAFQQPQALPIVPYQPQQPTRTHQLIHPTPHPKPTRPTPPRTCQPQLICSISAGFDKGDYLIREERGSNIYFDFLEEAYNFACQKGYSRMPKHEEKEYMHIIKMAHRSVPGGCRYNTGRLLMVLRKKLVPVRVVEDDEPNGPIMDENEESEESFNNNSADSSEKKNKKKLARSTNTLPTDSESSSSVPSSAFNSSAYSNASSSYVDSWE